MTYLSIIEKLQILFKTILDFKFILVFTILVLIFTLLYVLRKFNGRKYILCMTLLFGMVFGISIISNYKILAKTFDNFATILFGNIYFPSIYVYIGVLVISFIVFITSILNVKLKRVYKIINSIMFVINNILFVVILNIIAKNKIDIFSVNSLYSDITLVALLELSMGLFILWVLSIVVVYITDYICGRIAYKKVCHADISQTLIDSAINGDNYVEASSSNDSDNRVLLMNETASEDTIQNDMVIEDNCKITNSVNCIDTYNPSVQEDDANPVTFNDILNGITPVTYYDNSVIGEEYELVDPQDIYEKKYEKIKKDEDALDSAIELLNNSDEILELSVEEKTLMEKEKVKEERLISNTISLNDLIDDEIDNNRLEIEMVDTSSDVLEEEKNTDYTVEDYKKISKMLQTIKAHSNTTDVTLDDAVAISLISNYSIDDCMKFKNILENNLN